MSESKKTDQSGFDSDLDHKKTIKNSRIKDNANKEAYHETLTDIYGSSLNKSYLYIINYIADNYTFPTAFDVINNVYLPYFGKTKIEDVIGNFSENELKTFQVFVYSSSLDELNLEGLFERQYVEALRRESVKYLIDFEDQIKDFLKVKLGMYSGLDYVMTSRIKTFTSIVFNRLLTLKSLQDIPDLLGSRIVLNSIDNFTEVKKVFVDVNQSPIALNTGIKSHVWDQEEGYRDTTQYSLYYYQSLDLFVSLKSEQNSKSVFDNIDLQIRAVKNENKINISPANHTFYKNKQLYSFLLKFMFNSDYRENVMSHIGFLSNEALTLKV